ncbi:MAG TPA: tRNA-dihydrouridine synthase family protein [Vicinamibacterales bacterium]|nr:tRNA-dihydrouridine synthase family protein [Vicinamibacterales bacterium]HOQ60742.1 tRNA-dihydrouridine synthase family protein [Vicinamibacterales bacterium]HPK70641.1 tRNA-dihydrouridine synthase family protein [Vicinamibacterales bacterium]
MAGLRDALDGALLLAPMTRGGNLPYRRLCVELGARVLMGEMTVARRLKQRRRGEYALIRRAPDEPFFGVQLAGTDADEMGWAAALAEERGADLVDINFGCPIDVFTRRGLGAALGRQPKRIRRIVEGVKRAVVRIPVTAKIRLGWNESSRNYLEQAQAAVDGGADALVVHGRTRDARYRQAADWDAIGELVAALPVPVVGNGDALFPADIEAARARSGCAAVMAGRGALIKPWLFREAREGYWDLSAEDRLRIYRRYVDLAREHWGEDAHGLARVGEFVRWHLAFWCRYAPRRADGTWPGMQVREPMSFARSPLEALLARADHATLDWLARRLTAREEIVPTEAPAPDSAPDPQDDQAEG